MGGFQSGSHAIAWAAILTSSSLGFLRPSAIDVVKSVHVFLYLINGQWAVRPIIIAMRMKKILLLLILVITSISAFADDRYAYVSNVEHSSYYSNGRSFPIVRVTVSAKRAALDTYNQGFMVSVRPARELFDALIITNGSAKTVRLTKEEPSQTVIFDCNEDYTGKKACRTNDFVVTSHP